MHCPRKYGSPLQQASMQQNDELFHRNKKFPVDLNTLEHTKYPLPLYLPEHISLPYPYLVHFQS